MFISVLQLRESVLSKTQDRGVEPETSARSGPFQGRQSGLMYHPMLLEKVSSKLSGGKNFYLGPQDFHRLRLNKEVFRIKNHQVY